ncbi:hypothetical protein BC938DRAFT_483800 [Jimgerdemannia flammicorona]|uniref:PARP catalytic domain-containing protein n=1 Tax=Jimgerdemannia flammicorona TaxID=994334 RepID=A0A433QB45_9FUNG|nr:hypothetical protein BC938DRAFT_483800 [Jimgerdemannia flammicorona]
MQYRLYPFPKCFCFLPYSIFKYRIARVRKVSNPALRTSFHAYRSKLLQQGRDATVKRAFHSTLSTVTHKGETDTGWFGSGLYFSAYPDYTFCYNNKPPRPLQEGDKGSVILFDVCLGKIKKLTGLNMGGTLTPGYNSPMSPKGCEWVISDQNQCSPRFILDFVVERLPLKKKLSGKIWEDGEAI